MRQGGRGGRRALFKGLMVTVDKEWVDVLAEEYLPSGFCLLSYWDSQRCSLFCVAPFPLPSMYFGPNEVLFLDLSSTRRMSTGSELSASGSWKR